jgi:hypothetical protein
MRFILAALFAVLTPATALMAHPDHDIDEPEDLTPEQVARASIVRLVSQTKLPVSWTKASLVQTKLRTVKGLRQTVLTFNNAREANKAKQTLFVVLDNQDAFVSADHVLK